MKKHISVLARGISLLLAGVSWSLPADARTPHRTKFITGVFIGDSNTAPDTAVGLGAIGFVNWFNILLGYRYQFFNGGCYAATSKDWWPPSSVHQPYAFCYSDSGSSPRLFDVRAAPFLPSDFAVIMLGSNDSVGVVEPPDNTPTTVEEYGQNIEGMAFKIIKLGTPLVVLMTPATRIDCIEQAMQGRQAGIDCLSRLEGYTDEVKRICNISETDGVVCGPDVQAMSSADPWLYFEFGSTDKTHFTDAGHAAIANALVETLDEHGVGRPRVGTDR